MIQLSDILNQVYARTPRGIELGLQRVQTACEAIGHPLDKWGVVHVAGTNGKGSVAAITSLALQKASYRVGLFTSPHLCRFAERIRINQEPIDDELLIAVLTRALRLQPELTFFELTFVSALLAFDASDIDCAVLEVGLGGRLDATNVVRAPVATTVTSIGLDHTAMLGSTLREVAYEKASIAKPGAPMVVGAMPKEAKDEVVRVAQAQGASSISVIDEYDIDVESALTVRTSWGPLTLEPRLPGHHQRKNAAVVATLCGEASRDLSRLASRHVCDAIANVRWPARLESISHNGVQILLDGAHNPAGIEALCAYLESNGRSASTTAIIFGAMRDKDWRQMLNRLANIADRRFYVTPHGRAPARTQDLVAVAPGIRCASVAEALANATRDVGKGGRVVVCGSIFLAAEARAHVLNVKTDPLVAL